MADGTGPPPTPAQKRERRKRAAERSRERGYREERGLAVVRPVGAFVRGSARLVPGCPLCGGTRLVKRGSAYYTCQQCFPPHVPPGHTA